MTLRKSTQHLRLAYMYTHIYNICVYTYRERFMYMHLHTHRRMEILHVEMICSWCCGRVSTKMAEIPFVCPLSSQSKTILKFSLSLRWPIPKSDTVCPAYQKWHTRRAVYNCTYAYGQKVCSARTHALPRWTTASGWGGNREGLHASWWLKRQHVNTEAGRSESCCWPRSTCQDCHEFPSLLIAPLCWAPTLHF